MSFLKYKISDITLLAWNWPWWKYSHYRNGPMPSRKLVIKHNYNHILHLLTIWYISYLLIVCLLFSPQWNVRLPRVRALPFLLFILISPEPKRVSGTEEVFNEYFCMKVFCSVTVMCSECSLPYSSSVETAGLTPGSCVTALLAINTWFKLYQRACLNYAFGIGWENPWR